MSMTATATTAFRLGQIVTATSAFDSECIWTFEVIHRSAKFVTLRDVDTGDLLRVGVRVHYGEEWASPFGRYSMAPVVRAAGR